MKKFLLLLSLLALIVFSCSEQEEIDGLEMDQKTLEEKAALNEENVMLNDFANIIAKSMDTQEGRSFIKEQALKQFDGDYDILLAQVKDEKLSETSLKNSGYQTYGHFLKSFCESDGNLKSDDFDAFINSLLNENPLLQISVPEIDELSTENWDDLNYIPLVAVLPDNYDENITEVITAFDIDGNVSYLDIHSCPENPVIVIGTNERLVAIEKDQKVEYPCAVMAFETETHLYLIPDDCEGGGGSAGGGSGTGGDTGGGTDPDPDPDRDSNNDSDQLYKGKFVSKTAYRQVEPWPSGRPEFKVILTYIEKTGTTYETKTITKILSKDDWVTRYVFWTNLKTKYIKLSMIYWDKEKYGTTMKYTWIEQDDSDTKVELNIAASTKFGEDDNETVSGSIKVTISAKDDEAGEALVEYSDNTEDSGTEYSTGIMRFWIRQH